MLVKIHGLKTEPGDPLPSFLMRRNIDVILPHVVKLVNLSVSTANFDGLKKAHVIAFLKSLQLGNENFKNYHPISLLTFVSKLTEWVIHARVNAHLTVHALHTPSQFRYQEASQL